MEPIIATTNLNFSYGDNHVLHDVTFSMTPGELVVILGPNGVGKTTLIEQFIGTLRPQSGDVTVLGTDPRTADASFWSRIGLVQQSMGDNPKWRLHDQLNWIAACYDHVGRSPRDIDATLADVGLTDKKKSRLDKLSGGQRRRADIAMAIIGQPDLLMLDEPTTGLDPDAKASIHDLIIDAQDRGVSVFMSTHDLAEAEKLATRVLIMNRGRLIADDTVANLRKKLSGMAEVVWDEGGKTFVHVTDTPEKFIATRDPDAISNLSINRPTLEDVYMNLINGDTNDDTNDDVRMTSHETD